MPFSATRELWLVLKARDEANRALRSFSSNVRNAGRQVQMAEALAGKADAQRLLRMQRLRGATAEEVQTTKNLIDEYDRQYRSLKVLDAEEQQHGQRLMRINQQLSSVAASASAAGLVLTGAGIAGLLAMKNLTDAAIEYERQVRLTLTQVDGFKTTTKELGDIGKQVASNVAVPLDQLQSSLYDIFSSTSANVGQARTLLEAFAKTAVAGQVDLQDASRGTIAILNSFNIPFEDVNKVLDVQFQLVRKGVGTYEEFSKVFGRIVPSANRAGQNFETVSAILAYLTRNGLSAAMAATSGARALDAFSHPKAVANLEAMGIKVRDVKGNFLPLVDTLTQLRDKLMKLPPADRVAQIVEIFKGAGGTIQARRFIEQVLLKPGELEEFKGFLKDMQNSTGQFEQAYNEMADTASSKSQLLANKWQVLKVNAGTALIPTFLKIVDALGKVFDWFNKLSPKQQQFITLIFGGGAALTALLGVLLLVVAGLAAIAAAVAVAGTAFLVTTGIIVAIIAAFVGFVAAIIVAWNKSETFRKSIEKLGDTGKRLYNEAILPMAQGIKDAWDKYMGPALQKLSDVLRNQVFPVLSELEDYFLKKILPAAKEVANWTKTMFTIAFQKLSEIINKILIPAITSLTDWYHRHEGAVKTVIDIVIFLGKEIGKFLAIAILPLVTGIGMLVASLAMGIQAFIVITEIISKVVDWVKTAIKWFGKLDDLFGGVLGNIGSTFKGVMAKLGDLKNDIVGWFKDAATWLFNAGIDMITGLINGVKSKASDAIDAIKGVAGGLLNAAKGVLHIGSPSKAFMKIGQAAVDGFMIGLSGLKSGAYDTMTAMLRSSNQEAIGPRNAGRGTTNQTINVYTNEINPKKHSEELGFLLSARP